MGNLNAHHLTYRVGNQTILTDISLTIGRGEYVAIVGPNGAGKTTLVKCMAGILRPTAGTVSIDERRIDVYSRRELARRIAYVPQADRSDPPFTVREFIAMGRYPHGGLFMAQTDADRRAVEHAMSRTGARPLADRMLETLSGGERQKVHVAAAMAQAADILLLDEPDTFLDYRHQAEVSRILHGINATGVTVVSVTHDLNRAATDCQRLIALKAGSVLFDGPPESMLDVDLLRRLYDIDFELITAPGRAVPLIAPPRTEPSATVAHVIRVGRSDDGRSRCAAD